MRNLIFASLVFFLSYCTSVAQSELDRFKSYVGTEIDVESIEPRTYTVIKFGTIPRGTQIIDTTVCRTNHNNPIINNLCKAQINDRQHLLWPGIVPYSDNLLVLHRAVCDDKKVCSLLYSIIDEADKEKKYVQSFIIDVNGTLNAVENNSNQEYITQNLSFGALVVLFRVGNKKATKSILGNLYKCRYEEFQNRMDFDCLVEKLKTRTPEDLFLLDKKLSKKFGNF